MDNEKNKKQAYLKILAISVLGLVIFAILMNIDGNTNYMGPGMMERMHGSSGVNNTLPNFLLGVVSLSAKIVGLLLFIGIVIIVGLLIKKNLLNNNPSPLHSNENERHYTNCPNCQNKILDEFKFCPVCSTKLIEECVKCQSPIQGSWKCCPYCGNDIKEKE